MARKSKLVNNASKSKATKGKTPKGVLEADEYASIGSEQTEGGFEGVYGDYSNAEAFDDDSFDDDSLNGDSFNDDSFTGGFGSNDAFMVDSLSSYLNEISRFPLLTAEEELTLAQRAAQGDDAAKEKLIVSNLRLVVSIARKYENRGLSLQDLIQEGNIGLMNGIKGFDYTKGYRISTYCSKAIKLAITRALTDYSRLIRYPANVVSVVNKANYKTKELAVKLGHEPSQEEIVEALGKEMNLNRREALDLVLLPKMGMSLDTPICEDGNEVLFGDVIADEVSPSIDDMINSAVRKDSVRKLLGTLDDRERKIIKLRFGFDGEEEHTLEAAGRKCNYSRETIRQIEKDSIIKMRRVATPDMAC